MEANVSIQRYESGNIDIKRRTALMLAEILQTSPAYIMGWEDDSSDYCELSSDEQNFLEDYRSLNDQGKEYMRQTMAMALNTYKKHTALSDMEASQEIG